MLRRADLLSPKSRMDEENRLGGVALTGPLIAMRLPLAPYAATCTSHRQRSKYSVAFVNVLMRTIGCTAVPDHGLQARPSAQPVT